MRCRQQAAAEEEFGEAFAPPPKPQPEQRALPKRLRNEEPQRVKQALELRGSSKELPVGITFNTAIKKLVATVRITDDAGEVFPLTRVIDPELHATADEAVEAAEEVRAALRADPWEDVARIRAQRRAREAREGPQQ
ncbi:unnamed protein product [Amoebophrya sp. A120]|nr:unnamed protein product [Amoebophrya sp. A120]|eukprot:GSA120T00024186001.1